MIPLNTCHHLFYCAYVLVIVSSFELNDLKFVNFNDIPERLNLTPSLIPAASKEAGEELGLDWSPMCCMWAQMGYCDTHPAFMKPHCQKSCGTFGCKDDSAIDDCEVVVNIGHCPYIKTKLDNVIHKPKIDTEANFEIEQAIVDERCQDRHGSCVFWKQFGYCNKEGRGLRASMTYNCPRSCSFCDQLYPIKKLIKLEEPPAESALFRTEFQSRREGGNSEDSNVLVFPPGTKLPPLGVPINDVIKNGLREDSGLGYFHVMGNQDPRLKIGGQSVFNRQQYQYVLNPSQTSLKSSGRRQKNHKNPRIAQKNLRRKWSGGVNRNRIFRAKI